MFYVQYAARNIWRNRRWSSFAVFSIAAGVATIVALRSLGLAIGDSLTNNVRSTNHGDITMTRGFSGGVFAFTPPDDSPVFSDAEIQRVTNWVNERGGQISSYISSGAVQVTAVGRTNAGRPQFITSYFIDPQTYPPTQDIRASNPPDVPLRDLFQGGNEVVISENLADSQNIQVGDRVRVSGTTDEFIVRGIVPTEVEAGLNNIFAAFFGFAYFDIALAEPLSLNPNPNQISLTLLENIAPTTLDEAGQIQNELSRLLNEGRFTDMRSVPQLLEQNRTIADYTGRFIVVMGLGAMLIGGVGIVNTMLVMVRRRTEEIAALKTFGLKGRQIALLFMSEALLLGLAGSLIGGVFGIVLSAGANAYGETLIQQPLIFRLYPEAVLFGLALGLIVTAVFGVLPVLTAVKIRPGIILRPNETHIPKAGVFQSILALLFVVVSMGMIAGQILGNISWGLIGVAATIVILGLLIGLLWILVWAVGRLPAFGNVGLRLALRNLRARRVRTATTLLAISAGMFALSSITFFGAGVRQILQTTLSQSLGGNVMIFPVLPAAIANPLIDSRLNTLEGVNARTRFINYQAEIKAIDGVEVDDEGAQERRQQLYREMEAAGEAQDFARMGQIGEELGSLPDYALSLSIRDTTGDNFGAESISQGRNFTAEDRGQRVALLQQRDSLPEIITIGTVVTLEIHNRDYNFEIVGLLPNAGDNGFQFGFGFGDMTVPPESLPAGGISDFQITLADVEPEALDKVLLELSALPLVFSIDITFIDGLLRRFIDQFSALPILVGLLSLGAAAVIMANTVALATLERRRQIGILKAVGLKGRRVLWIMLLENILVSLLGGILGVGLSALGVALMSAIGLQDITILVPADSSPIAIGLIVAAVLIGAVATFLSAQVAISERALNVLRYE
jgi:predicted lysophospholipase L1 biosynthesis ABC-type transport system permease subunit